MKYIFLSDYILRHSLETTVHDTFLCQSLALLLQTILAGFWQQWNKKKVFLDHWDIRILCIGAADLCWWRPIVCRQKEMLRANMTTLPCRHTRLFLAWGQSQNFWSSHGAQRSMNWNEESGMQHSRPTWVKMNRKMPPKFFWDHRNSYFDTSVMKIWIQYLPIVSGGGLAIVLVGVGTVEKCWKSLL